MSRKTFVYTSTSKSLGRLRSRIQGILKGQKFSPKDRDLILVALTEAFANAIRHSYQGKPGRKIRVTVEDRPQKMVFRVRDYGQKINLDRIRNPELPPQKGGGLGVYFMKAMMDGVEYNTAHRRGNELILTKNKLGPP